MHTPLPLLVTLALAACSSADAPPAALVTLSPESAGENCANGGTRISSGADTNGDGTLGNDEVTAVAYTCDGAAGAAGADGAAGSNGADGTPGQEGAPGVDGTNANGVVMTTTPESPGEHCPAGGTRIDVGIDDDADGVLDPEEIDATAYACNDEWNCYYDLDHDGHGGPVGMYVASGDCTGGGFSSVSDDCDDSTAEIAPGHAEAPGGTDSDCDGSVRCYADADGDRRGSTIETTHSVTSIYTDVTTLGCATSSDDCDDTEASTHPYAAETTGDGVDSDCNGYDDDMQDTGLAEQHWVSTITVRSGAPTSATFGGVFYGIPSGAPLCDFRGTLAYDGPSSRPSCPGCTWSFALGSLSGSRGGYPLAPLGDCADVEMSDGMWDGYFAYDWAFAPTYAVDGRTVTNALLLGLGSDWYLFGYNDASSGRSEVTWDGTTMDFVGANVANTVEYNRAW